LSFFLDKSTFQIVSLIFNLFFSFKGGSSSRRPRHVRAGAPPKLAQISHQVVGGLPRPHPGRRPSAQHSQARKGCPPAGPTHLARAQHRRKCLPGQSRSAGKSLQRRRNRLRVALRCKNLHRPSLLRITRKISMFFKTFDWHLRRLTFQRYKTYLYICI